MKILLVTEQFPPLLGGGAVYYYSLFKNFSRDEIVVYTARRKGAPDFDRSQKTLRIIRGWIWNKPVFSFNPAGIIGPFYLWLALLKLVKKEKPDIIHCGAVIPFGFYGLFFKRFFRTPYILHTLGEEITYFKKSRFKKKIISNLLQNADKVITLSRFIKREVIELGVREENTAIIPLWVDTDRFKPRDVKYLKEKLHLQDKKIILTVSRLVERKNHETVIKSLPKILEKVPDLVYIIVGIGPTEGKLKKLAKEINLDKYIIFTGRLPHNSLADYYNVSDVFIMPNRVLEETGELEGLGVVFLEANACGKPVIGGRSGGTEDAIIDGKTGLLIDKVTDPDEISRAILKLLLDEELCRKMGEDGRERVREHFNWKITADKLRKINKTIIGNEN